MKNNFLQSAFGLVGKRAVVTGAGRGIAVALASAGAQVLIHCRQGEDAVKEIVKEIELNGGL